MSCEPRAPIRVQLREGAAAAPELSDDEQRAELGEAGFALAAVYAWREGEQSGWDTHEEVWLRPDTIAWIDARGVVNLLTRFPDGAQIAHSGPSVQRLWAAHHAQVEAAGAQPVVVGSWREAPGASVLVHLAWRRLVERQQEQRSNGAAGGSVARWFPLVFFALFMLPSLLSGDRTALLSVGLAFVAMLWWFRARRPAAPFVEVAGEAELAALYPDLVPSTHEVTTALPVLMWIHADGDPAIAALALARPSERELLTNLGFHRIGAVRKRADFGLVGHPVFHEFGVRALAGRALTEVWLSPDGDEALIDCSVEPELVFRTVLDDGSLVSTFRCGPRTFAETNGWVQLDPREGAFTHLEQGEPEPEVYTRHRARVDAALETTGAQVVPLRTLDDVLFAERLSSRVASMGGAAMAARMLRGGGSWVRSAALILGAMLVEYLLEGQIVWSLALVVGWGVVAWAGGRAARATAPPKLPVAQLRQLPHHVGPDGGVGHWIG